MVNQSRLVWNDYEEVVWPMLDAVNQDTSFDQTGKSTRTDSELTEGHIRLVKIETNDGVICCNTRTFGLESSEAYVALSYTWGSPIARHRIVLDGRRHLVPKNLWRFLQQVQGLRNRFPAWFWIDVLCINQSCQWEKTHQVGIMSKIFENAERVIVWTGPAYGASEKAMEALSEPPSSSKHNKTLAKIFANPVGPAIQSFCERPYWRRLWVFQELKFARDITLVCGKMTLSWRRFKEFLLHAYLEGLAPRLYDKINSLRTSPAGTMVNLTCMPLNTSLWALLLVTKHLQCAEPHDKVYALLSVAKSGHEGIYADYAMPIPVLLNSVLKNLHAHVPPESLEEVISQCQTLERVFDIPPDSMFVLPVRGVVSTSSYHFPQDCYRLGPDTSCLSLWWTSYYGHSQVEPLLLRGWKYSWFEWSIFPSPEEILETQHALEHCEFVKYARSKGVVYVREAIKRRDRAVLRLLVALGIMTAEANVFEYKGLLHDAIRSGDTDIVSELLKSQPYNHERRKCWDSDFWKLYRTVPVEMQEVLKGCIVEEQPAILPILEISHFDAARTVVSMPPAQWFR